MDQNLPPFFTLKLLKSGDMEELKELETLESELESTLNRVRQKQDELTAKRMGEAIKKEQELVRENESLRKELKELQRLWLGGGSDVEAAATSTDISYDDGMASVDSGRSDSFLQLRLHSHSGIAMNKACSSDSATE